MAVENADVKICKTVHPNFCILLFFCRLSNDQTFRYQLLCI